MSSNDMAVCPVCTASTGTVFLELPALPVLCNRLWPTREAARSAPRGDLRLAFCRSCTHVFNSSFRQERIEYAGEYENSLHFSPHFQEYSRSLAEYLVDKFNLHNRCVLEIGCGKGEFLALLTDLGGNRGIGFDPSYRPGRIPAAETARMHVVRDLFPGLSGMSVDFFCCRHVLEHVAEPVRFLSRLRPSAGHRPIPVFFEVPNVLSSLRDLGIWDLIYEHPSYFGPASLGRAFQSAGFEIMEVREAFSGQCLWVEALAVPERSACLEEEAPRRNEMARLVERFQERFLQRIAAWREVLAKLRRRGSRAVVWGAGSKGVNFLNILAAGEEIVGAVDLNPHKWHKFVPGAGQPVVAPEDLRELAPDLVIVMNAVYRREIGERLKKLNLRPEIRVA